MFERIVQDIQKLINSPFRYTELVKLLENKKDFLLKPNVMDKSDDAEYNAMWDTMIEVERFFIIFVEDNMMIITDSSVSKLFQYYLKIRKNGK